MSGAETRPDRSPLPSGDPYTAMTPRFGRLARLFGRRFFGAFQFEPGGADALRDLESKSAVVYVMRYSSRLDYFLFNWLFLANGIRLSGVANGIRFYYYRPLGEGLRLLVRGIIERARLGRPGMREQQIRHMRELCGWQMCALLRRASLDGSTGCEVRSSHGRA